MSNEILIKNKIELRKEIKKRIGGVGQFDYIEIYHDGTWDIMNCSTHSTYFNVRMQVVEFLSHYVYENTKFGCDYCISENFKEIEHRLFMNRYGGRSL